MTTPKKHIAKLFSNTPPKGEQLQRFTAFIKRKYGEDTELCWIEDTAIENGFRLEVGTNVYDWTEKGLLAQFDGHLDNIKYKDGMSIVPLIRNSVEG